MYTPIFAMTPYQMTWQTYLTFGLYLLLMIGTGLYFCWRANNNLEDYLLGGRGLGSWSRHFRRRPATCPAGC